MSLLYEPNTSLGPALLGHAQQRNALRTPRAGNAREPAVAAGDGAFAGRRETDGRFRSRFGSIRVPGAPSTERPSLCRAGLPGASSLCRAPTGRPATTLLAADYVDVLSVWRYRKIRKPMPVQEFFLALARLGGPQHRAKAITTQAGLSCGEDGPNCKPCLTATTLPSE